MSWSYTKTGKAKALKDDAIKQLMRYDCSEPEHSIIHDVVSIITRALSAMPPDKVVNIEASGSQSTNYQTGEVTNTLSLKLCEVYGFIE